MVLFEGRRSVVVILVVVLMLGAVAPVSAAGRDWLLPDAPAARTWDESLPDLAARCQQTAVVIEAKLGIMSGQGSGVIVDPSGKVLTAHHVVGGAKSVLVKLYNGGYFPAEGYLGLDPAADWALLRVPGRDLPHATIADYTELRPGDKLVVVSSPSGLENTVSEGIVSGLRRAGELSVPNWQALEELGFEQDSELIQFSAPISPGSSGGPVFNARGEVVGIVILKHHADNVYFATPAKLALEAMDREEITAFDAMDLGVIGGERIDTGRNPSSVGRGKPVRAKTTATVPSKGMPFIQLEHTRFVLPDSVEIEDRDTGEKLRRVDRPPGAGEFRSVSGGRVYFHADDAGRRLRITYDHSVERIAVLPPLDVGERPELVGIFVEAFREECRKMGLEPAPQAESEAAFYALDLPAALDEEGLLRELRPEVIRRLAAETNARYVVVSVVSEYSIRGAWASAASFDGHTGELLSSYDREETFDAMPWVSGDIRRERSMRDVVAKIAPDLLDAR